MQSVQVVLSDEHPEFQHFAPAAVGPPRLWAVWQAYHRGWEQILARLWDERGLQATEQVSPPAGLHQSPCVGMVGDVPVAVWLQGVSGRSAVVAATRSPSGWSTPAAIGGHGHAVGLHAASDGRRLWAAWCAGEAPQTYSVCAAAFDGRGWRPPVRVTPENVWVQRPEVAAADGGCWVAWDAYDGHTFAVWAAFVHEGGSTSAPERVSAAPAAEGMVRPDAWQLGPSVCVDGNGQPWVAWLCTQDVANDDGVVNYWPTTRVARRGPGGWTLVRDGDGSADLARLAWGLLSWQGRGVWGYLGRRRKPLLVADPAGGAWLLWERKEIPDGSTPQMQGILCARRLEVPPERGGEESASVGPTLAVAIGPRWFVPAGVTLVQGRRRLWVAGRVAPSVSSTDVLAAAYELDGAPPLQDEGPWEGWRPAVVRERRPEARSRAEVDGQVLQLYWADLHVHSALSADADEGYLDEVIAYARDKAGLDCLALSNNDHHVLSMTQSDYETYCHYVRHFHEEGCFVLLPAWEWTYRPRPGGPPNHRTVIGREESLPLLRHTEVGGEPMAALAALAERHGALLHLHHERWELTDSPAEANIEVCSGWGVHMLDPRYVDKVHAALAAGRRLGFVGNSDNHRRNPGLGGGLTGVYAEALTRAAVFEALRRRRCFATDGTRIALQFWVDEAFMGGEVVTQEAPRIRWRVACTAPPATVRLLRDGEVVRAWPVPGREGTGACIDAACGPGDHFYYLAVEQSSPWRHYPSNVAVARGPRAWSSPIRVRRGG